jgi:hypothetical protein
MPEGTRGGECMVRNSKLARRLRMSMEIEEKGEHNTIPEFELQVDARVYILDKEEVLKYVHTREKGHIPWAAGLRLEHKEEGSAVVWKEGEMWKQKKSYLGKKK